MAARTVGDESRDFERHKRTGLGLPGSGNTLEEGIESMIGVPGENVHSARHGHPGPF